MPCPLMLPRCAQMLKGMAGRDAGGPRRGLIEKRDQLAAHNDRLHQRLRRLQVGHNAARVWRESGLNREQMEGLRQQYIRGLEQG